MTPHASEIPMRPRHVRKRMRLMVIEPRVEPPGLDMAICRGAEDATMRSAGWFFFFLSCCHQRLARPALLLVAVCKMAQTLGRGRAGYANACCVPNYPVSALPSGKPKVDEHDPFGGKFLA